MRALSHDILHLTSVISVYVMSVERVMHYLSSSHSATPLAQLPPVADPDFPPLYTNVEFARESVHGRTMKAGSPHRSFPKEGMQPGRRK